MVSLEKKRATITEIFGVPFDPDEDVNVIDFLYARRHLAIVEERGWRELAFITELDNLEREITKALDHIRARDGDRICKEAASYLLNVVEVGMSKRRHREQTP